MARLILISLLMPCVFTLQGCMVFLDFKHITSSPLWYLEKALSKPEMAITALVFFVGVWVYIAILKKGKKLEEYEFNNITDGGVVRFDNYKDSKKHERTKTLLAIAIQIDTLVVFLSFLLLA